MIAEKRNSKKEIELFFRDRQKIKEKKSKDKRQKVPKDITWNLGHYLIIRFTNKNSFNKLREIQATKLKVLSPIK